MVAIHFYNPIFILKKSFLKLLYSMQQIMVSVLFISKQVSPHRYWTWLLTGVLFVCPRQRNQKSLDSYQCALLNYETVPLLLSRSFAQGMHMGYFFARSLSMAGHGHSGVFSHGKRHKTMVVGSTEASLGWDFRYYHAWPWPEFNPNLEKCTRGH